MMMPLPKPLSKVLIAIGTRPEIIKMAPVYYEFKKSGIETLLLHTGQHSDMAEALYQFSGITPDFNIKLDRAIPEEGREIYNSCELSNLGALLLQKISGVIADIDDLSLILVHGDTTSALMAAMAAFYKKIPVAHVEAGLRTHQRYSPFPEEKNRTIIAHLSSWHFAPTELTRDNLLNEGIPDSQIHVVGNTIVEAARLGIQKFDEYRESIKAEPLDIIAALDGRLDGKKLITITVHRHENQSGNIPNIADAILQLVTNDENLIIVWPVHPNPKVKNAVYKAFRNLPPVIADRIHLTEPLNYSVLLWLLKNSWVILTDSGGIQEEAAALGTPVMVLRDATERSEIIESGTGVLIGTETHNIVARVTELRQNTSRYLQMKNAKNPFGDGKTAEKICQILMKEHFP